MTTLYDPWNKCNQIELSYWPDLTNRLRRPLVNGQISGIEVPLESEEDEYNRKKATENTVSVQAKPFETSI